MSEAQGMRRRRRGAGGSRLPEDLRAWFAGELRAKDGLPWAALVYPDYVVLPERWRQWKAENPHGTPPAGFEWLDGPTALHRHPDWLREMAAQMIARRR